MKFLKLGVFAAAIGLAVAIGGSYLAPVLLAPRQNFHANSADPALAERGRYIAQASDCVACHTAKGDKLSVEQANEQKTSWRNAVVR